MKQLTALLILFGSSLLGAAGIPMLDRAPVIDGQPGDPGWSKALKVPFVKRNGYALLGRTATHIYAAIQAEHGSLKDKNCVYTGKDSEVYNDDTLDFFFNTSNGKQDYGQIIANVNGAVFDHVKDQQRKAYLNWDSGAAAKGSYGENSFYIELCVPVASLAPAGGKLGIAIAAYTRWNMLGEAVLGQYHKPETFTYFDMEPFPLQCVSAQWPVFAGMQTARFEFRNISEKPLSICGMLDRRRISFPLGAKQSRIMEFPLTQQSDRECVHTLILTENGRPVLQLNRTTVPRPVMNAVLRSDILFEGEEVPLLVTINEKQREPLKIDCGSRSVRCSYKGNAVELPFQRVTSPWEEK